MGSVTAPRRSIDINNEGIKKESQVTGSKKRLILLTIEQVKCVCVCVCAYCVIGYRCMIYY